LSVTEDKAEPWSFNIGGDLIEEYRRILHSVGSHQGIYRRDDGEIDIPLWMQGCAVCGEDERGYAILAKPPKHLVPDIGRELSTSKGRDYKLYQRLDGKWYLYVDIEDCARCISRRPFEKRSTFRPYCFTPYTPNCFN
jgi:hypothetical protein